MSSHVFHEIYLHFNWHTKGDYPSLQGQVEQLAHTFVREKAAQIKGALLHKLGGTDTHVHLAIQIEPFVRISDLIQELKGASSFEVNRRMGHKALEWQRGYGVVSFGRRHLPWICDYVERQREHHAANRVHRRLEACDFGEPLDEKAG
jgi:putative transposase